MKRAPLRFPFQIAHFPFQTRSGISVTSPFEEARGSATARVLDRTRPDRDERSATGWRKSARRLIGDDAV